MDDRRKLLDYGKKIIDTDRLLSLIKVSPMDIKAAHRSIEKLVKDGVIEPVRSSGKNGNLSYPLYKKYRIICAPEDHGTSLSEIKKLHAMLLKSGYLSLHPEVYSENRDVIHSLNRYFFSNTNETFISRKERSFEIFGREKVLGDKEVRSLLVKLGISENDLRFYDTPEYCFHDYIPKRRDDMTLLICENKDIWFNIRRCMFEDGFTRLFGTDIDGVVYGNGNKVSQRQGALVEYVKFMGDPIVRFLYWGDIDREGFDIYRRTREVNCTLDISLFVPGYKKMIERAGNIILNESTSSKKEGLSFGELLDVFSEEEAGFLNEVLKSNKQIPQEIISYTILSED